MPADTRPKSTPPPVAATLNASAVGGTPPELLSRLVEYAPIAIAVVTGPEHRVLLANAAYRTLSGAVGHPIGRPFADAFPALATPERFAIFEEVQRSGRAVRLDECHHAGMWWDVEHAPYLDNAGHVVGVMLLALDVSDRVRAKHAAQQTETKLSSLLESISDGFVTVDDQGRFTFANKMASRLLGCTPEQLINRTLDEVFPSTERSVMHDVIRQALAQRQSAHVESFCPNLRRWFECRVQPSSEGLSIFFADTTDRRAVADTLRENEARFRMLAEALPAIVWSATPDGNVDYMNQRWTQYTGMRAGHGWGWAAMLHPEDDAAAIEAWKKALANGAEYEAEHRLRRFDGQFRWHLSRAVPLRESSGAIAKWIATMTDIHDQKRIAEELDRHREHLEELVRERTAELEQSYTRLRLSERMASLGNLSAGLGHDMGNLLLPIRVRLESMEKRGLPEPFLDDVHSIRTSAEYLQRLTNGLRLLALDPEKPGLAGDQTNLGDWWADVEPLLKNALPRGVTLSWRGDGSLKVQLARHRLTQAVFNLVQNAGDVLRVDGVGAVTVDAELRHDRVALSVTDNGPGMTDEVRSRCLEPFFSTKTRDISTGMGLALVRGIVLNAGGDIKVDSVLGKGATFTLDLPLARPADEHRPVAVISLPDIRIGTYVASVLRSMAWEVQFGEEPQDDDTRLWVVGEPPPPAASSTQTRVLTLAAAAKPAEIRQALRQAVQDAKR